jgi:hypothetical protein
MGRSLPGSGPASPREPGGKDPPRSRAEAWPGDERAARRFAAGEPGSLELLVRHFAEDLFPYAARLAGVERGEDLLEEAFVRALDARGRYRGEPPLGEWLRGLVEESARDRFRRPAGSSPVDPAAGGVDAASPPLDLALPFALASRLVSRVEERQRGPGAAFRRAGLLRTRTRVLAVVGVVIGGALLAWGRRPPVSLPEGPRPVAVFFDSSDVVKEAVTPPGKIPVVTLHPGNGESPRWRLLSSAVQPRIPSALTALFRLDLDSSGRVKGVRRLFSVPSVPPAGVEQMLLNLRFAPISGDPAAGSVDVRIVAE